MAIAPLFQSISQNPLNQYQGGQQQQPFQLNYGGGIGIGGNTTSKINPNSGTQIQNTQGMSPALTSSTMPMGLKPKSPAANIKSQPTTLPLNQISKSQIVPTNAVDNTGLIKSQLQSAQSQLGGLQNQLGQAQSLGYQPNQQINMGGNGQVLPPNTSQAGLISNLGGMAQTSSPQFQQAQQQYLDANQQLAALKANEAQQEMNIGGSRTNLAEAGGEQGLLQNLFANKMAALTGEMSASQSAAQTATGQQNTQQSGLQNAAGLLAPQQVPYSNQYLSPITGQPISGGGGSGGSALSSLPQQAQSAIQSYAQQVQNGSMTRADAESRLSAYGIVGTNALNEVLGNSFNTNASNASAGTTAVGQQIQTAANSTNQALDTLGSSFSSLNGLQTGGIPVTNSIAQWIGAQFGDSALTQYKTNLADARSQLIGVLNSSGGTPTGNEATANEYLPDSMTKAQFDQNVGTTQNPGIVRQLIAQKVGSFTQSGQQNVNNQNAPGTSIYNNW